MHICPRCEETLATINYEGVHIETCPKCGGEWCDAGELAHIAQTVKETIAEEHRTELATLDSQPVTAARVTPGEMFCPKCPSQTLVPFTYAGDSGIALDKCPQCQGVWLDQGELEKVQALVESCDTELPDSLMSAITQKRARDAAARPRPVSSMKASMRQEGDPSPWRRLLYGDLHRVISRFF